MSEVSQWMAKRDPVPHVKNVFVLYLALNHEDQFSRFESFEFFNIAYYRIATVRELPLCGCVWKARIDSSGFNRVSGLIIIRFITKCLCSRHLGDFYKTSDSPRRRVANVPQLNRNVNFLLRND